MSNFKVFPPKCEVLLLDTDRSATAQREDVFNQQERTKLSERRPSDLRSQVKELAQDYSFSEVGRRLRISKGAVHLDWKHGSQTIESRSNSS